MICLYEPIWIYKIHHPCSKTYRSWQSYSQGTWVGRSPLCCLQIFTVITSLVLEMIFYLKCSCLPWWSLWSLHQNHLTKFWSLNQRIPLKSASSYIRTTNATKAAQPKIPTYTLLSTHQFTWIENGKFWSIYDQVWITSLWQYANSWSSIPLITHTHTQTHTKNTNILFLTIIIGERHSILWH